MTTATASSKILDIKSGDEFISPSNRNLKAVIEQTLRYNGRPIAVAGIYRRGDGAWFRFDYVHVMTNKDYMIGTEKFWNQIDEELISSAEEDYDL
ncbi:hypothetical protein [Devosia alba]|uniref:hypothetical protein n=1 Tax=Devosia alba TaxID=3152360 RepID=UPI00326313F5